jgi:hypothetical protein
MSSMEWISETSSNSRGVSFGKIEGSREASIDLPAPGGPFSKKIADLLRRRFRAAFGALLALDVTKIWLRAGLRMNGRPRPCHNLCALKMIDELNQGQGCKNVDVLACPGGLRPARMRTDQPMAARICSNRGWQHASDRGDRSVERKFAENRGI